MLSFETLHMKLDTVREAFSSMQCAQTIHEQIWVELMRREVQQRVLRLPSG
jgi:hypothetical protein